MYYFRPGVPSSWACNAFFHASLNPKLLEANLRGFHWGKNLVGHVSEKFMPGMFFCSGTIRTERPGEDWVWDEKSSCRAWNFDFHARHENRNLMPGMTFVLVSAQSSLGRATFHARHEIWLYMPGMKIGFSCPAWKSTLYGQYENWLHMLGMKTNLKIAWSLSKSWVDILSGYKVSFLFRLKRHFLLHRHI